MARIVIEPAPGEIGQQTYRAQVYICAAESESRRARLEMKVVARKIDKFRVRVDGMLIVAGALPLLKCVAHPVAVSRSYRREKFTQIIKEEVVIHLRKYRAVERREGDLIAISGSAGFSECMRLRGTGDDDVSYKAIVISLIPLVKRGRVRWVDEDIVFDGAVIALAQLYGDSDTNIVVDVVMRRAIIQVDAELMNRLRLAEKVVSYHCHCAVRLRIIKNVIWIALVITGGMGCIPVRLLHAPEPPASPGIERAVIVRFSHRIVDIVELDDMAASPAVIHANGGTRHIVDVIMANDVSFTDGQKDTRDLLSEKSAIVDEVVRD